MRVIVVSWIRKFARSASQYVNKNYMTITYFIYFILFIYLYIYFILLLLSLFLFFILFIYLFIYLFFIFFFGGGLFRAILAVSK